MNLTDHIARITKETPMAVATKAISEPEAWTGT